MENSKDPLDILITKTEEVKGENRKKLAELLFPYVSIDPELGKTFFKEDIKHPLTGKQRVLIYILSRLAISQKNDQFSTESTSKEIQEGTNLPGGTVRPYLATLLKEKYIERNPNGYYAIVHHLKKAQYLFENEKD